MDKHRVKTRRVMTRLERLKLMLDYMFPPTPEVEVPPGLDKARRYDPVRMG